jgi:putative endonuclease
MPGTQEHGWVVYLLLCSDGTLYTGITNSLQRRVETHNQGKGAKYTRGRTPVRLLNSFAVGEKGEALRMERKVKRLTRAEKLSLDSLDRWRTQ